jgi:uncharacterized membrane protein
MAGEASMIAFAAAALALGMVAVRLYPPVTHALSAGIRTAATVGVVVWVLSCSLSNIVMHPLGISDAKLFWFATIWPLIEAVIAPMAGAKVCRHEPAMASVSARA